MGRGGLRGAIVLAALALLAAEAQGQRRTREYADARTLEPVGWFGVSLVGADPVGPLETYIDEGFGGQVYGTFPIEPSRHLRLRADFGFLIYGHERQRVCMGAPIGCRIELDMTTTNSILYGGLGPELVLARGAVEPYVNASFGFTYFATTSALEGENDFDSFASSTNYSDGNFAWRAGGGVRVRLSRGRVPVALDLGLERHQNGITDFLTKGDIIDNPDGSITVLPNRSEADLAAFRLGVTIGIPRPDGRNDHHRGRGW